MPERPTCFNARVAVGLLLTDEHHCWMLLALLANMRFRLDLLVKLAGCGDGRSAVRNMPPDPAAKAALLFAAGAGALATVSATIRLR
jgi:hypothetical protein